MCSGRSTQSKENLKGSKEQVERSVVSCSVVSPTDVIMKIKRQGRRHLLCCGQVDCGDVQGPVQGPCRGPNEEVPLFHVLYLIYDVLVVTMLS
jgi:hypothetical protein